MNDLGDAISWPARDAQWVTKIIVMSLITIIPVVGQMALLGWMLAAIDNLRASRRELPPIGFDHIGRGAALFLVQLVYALAVVVIAGVVFVGAAILAGATGGSGSAAAGAASALGFLLGGAIVIAGCLAVAYVSPAMILETDRGGIASGLNFSAVIGLAQRRPEASLIAALSLLVAYFLGSLGSLLCGVGLYLTIAYGYAVAAGVVRRYELDLGPAAPPHDAGAAGASSRRFA